MTKTDQTASNTYLYQRKGSYIPRIAAVHDLCGYGKCSLGVAIPVLSAAGCDVCPVPTALLSAHTKFPVFTLHDTTEMLDEYLNAWVKENIELDAIYSGFLGAAEQVEVIQRLYNQHKDALRIVDPVMGDAGKIYPTYTPELCSAMKDLVCGADLLTPNLTEASILTGIEYKGSNLDEAEVQEILDALLEAGAKNVVLKGIIRNDKEISNYIAGQDIKTVKITQRLLPYMLHGTGDLYCSSLLAAIMCEKSLQEAVEFAGTFVCDAMEQTRFQPDYEMRGVSFESVLGEITNLLS